MGTTFAAAVTSLGPPASLLVRRPLSSSAVLHVVNASPSSADRPGTRSALLSSSAVLSCEVKMLVIATAALLALSATTEAASIKYNHESRETHDSGESSYQHKRGFYYLDLQGKRINEVSSWLPTWSYSVEPSYTHESSKTQSIEPSHEPKPAYKEFHVPRATTKDNGQHGTNAMRKTAPKTAKTSGTTPTTTPTYRRKRKRSVRYVKSRPMYKQPHKYRSVRSVPSRPMYKQSYKHERRHKRSTGDNDETLMRLADALSLVTQSLLGQDGANRGVKQSVTETLAQGQDESEETVDEPEATVEVEPEATVEVEPEATVDEPEATVEVEPEATVDFPDEDQEDEEDEVSIDDDEEDDDEEDGDKDGDEGDKDGDKDGDEDEEDGDEDDEVDSDDEVDFKQEDPEEEPEEEPKKPKKKSKKPKKKSKKPKKSKKQNKKSKKLKEKPEEPEDTMDSDMDYYGSDGYPDYTHKPRKFRQSYRQSRPSYEVPAYRYKRSARGMRVSKSQAKKDGQKKMKKNKYKGRKH